MTAKKTFNKFLILICVLCLAVASGAKAIIPTGPVSWITGPVQGPYLAPFAISNQNSVTYDTYYNFPLLSSSWQASSLGVGRFGVVDFGNGDLKEQICGTVYNSVGVGAILGCVSGNKKGLIKQGMQSRIGQSNYDNDLFKEWVSGGCLPDRRIIVTPVIDGSQTQITVVGFTAFYIDNFDSGALTLSGRFTFIPEEALVPEPSSLLALLCGSCGFTVVIRRRKKKAIL
ncbi:MAG: PEP-CTERM sorting domain-containing protein [Armatimonadota bacterium]|nr:PEP-CTERM sorting domain-containing protein [Armatimonadota bacterium]